MRLVRLREVTAENSSYEFLRNESKIFNRPVGRE
jgi:hypothetical protein